MTFAHTGPGEHLDSRSSGVGAHLAKNGEVGALELAKALGIPRTPTIAFVVTTPLKRIASRLGLPWPFDVVTGSDRRTLWRDRDGIAGRMLDAIRKERQSRGI